MAESDDRNIVAANNTEQQPQRPRSAVQKQAVQKQAVQKQAVHNK